MSRAEVLLGALKNLMDTLISHPKDRNLICAIKLLKVTTQTTPSPTPGHMTNSLLHPSVQCSGVRFWEFCLTLQGVHCLS